MNHGIFLTEIPPEDAAQPVTLDDVIVQGVLVQLSLLLRSFLLISSPSFQAVSFQTQTQKPPREYYKLPFTKAYNCLQLLKRVLT